MKDKIIGVLCIFLAIVLLGVWLGWGFIVFMGWYVISSALIVIGIYYITRKHKSSN